MLKQPRTRQEASSSSISEILIKKKKGRFRNFFFAPVVLDAKRRNPYWPILQQGKRHI